LSQRGKAAWHEKDRERKVSLTEKAVNHRIEEWRLIVQEAKAHIELQRRGKGRKEWKETSWCRNAGLRYFSYFTGVVISNVGLDTAHPGRGFS
jgi:hypothetical protein